METDKAVSLAYIREIISHLTDESHVSLNVGSHIETYGELNTIIPYHHNLHIQTIFLPYAVADDDPDTDKDVKITDLDINQNIECFRETVRTQYTTRYTADIFNGSYVDTQDNIHLVVMSGFEECDVAYPVFSYNSQLGMWILMGEEFDAPGGIDENGRVVVLDFTECL